MPSPLLGCYRIIRTIRWNRFGCFLTGSLNRRPSLTSPTATLTNPYALCGYAISAVFVLLAKKWNPKSETPRVRQLFYFAISMAAAALFGGLFLAWHQLSTSSSTAPPCNVTQSSSGNRNPNINSCGSGTVTVQNGTTSSSQTKREEKAK